MASLKQIKKAPNVGNSSFSSASLRQETLPIHLQAEEAGDRRMAHQG